MLERLLRSFGQLDMPENADVQFVVVDNSEGMSSHPLNGALAVATILREPRPGIPIARNKALGHAVKADADWLVFVDDDEIVPRTWLVELLEGARNGDFDLAGGPVAPVAPAGTLTRAQQKMMTYYKRMADERGAAMGRKISVTDLPTNNWIARVDSMRRAGLLFDESLRFSGGSDTEFSRRASRAGLKTGWIGNASVYEEMDFERLRPGYLFRRARSQTLAKIQFEYVAKGKSIWPRAIFHVVAKGVSGLSRVLFSPIGGSYAGLRGLRALGVAAGWGSALLGKRSELYKQIIGR